MRSFQITVNGKVYQVQVDETTGAQSAPVPVAPIAPAVPAAPAAPTPAPAAAPVPTASAAPVSGESVTAPMPGTILSVSASVGKAVKKHDVLCVLEAMKMENEIVASKDGIVVQVLVSKGSAVNTGDKLIILG